MYSQLVCPVVKILGLKNEWTSIDYGGFERVNFSKMKWTYFDSQTNPEEDERNLKRVIIDNKVVWMITDDYGGWDKYDLIGGNEDELLEEWYQSWLKGE